jgi:hypothetical protein
MLLPQKVNLDNHLHSPYPTLNKKRAARAKKAVKSEWIGRTPKFD